MKKLRIIIFEYYPLFIYLICSIGVFFFTGLFFAEQKKALIRQSIERTEFNAEFLGRSSTNLLDALDLEILSITEKINQEKETVQISGSFEKFLRQKMVIHPQIKKITVLDSMGKLHWQSSHSNNNEEELYSEIFTEHVQKSLLFNISAGAGLRENLLIFSRSTVTSREEDKKFVIGELDLSSIFTFNEHRREHNFSRMSLLDNGFRPLVQKVIEDSEIDFSSLLDRAKKDLHLDNASNIGGGVKTLVTNNHIVSFYQLHSFPYYVALETDLETGLQAWNSQFRSIMGILFVLFILFLFTIYSLNNQRLQVRKREHLYIANMKESNDRYIAMAEDNRKIALSLSADILEREKSEKALLESEEKFRTLFELSPVGMAMIDHETGDFLEVNTAVLEPTGYTKEEFVALSFWDITPREYEKQEADQIECLNRTGNFGPNEKEYIRKDGTRYPIKLSGFLITNAQGRKVVWGIIENLTKSKQAEKEKALLQEQLNHKGKMDAIGQISGGLAHDFNNILNGIMSAAHLLKNENRNLDKKGFQYVEIIERASMRASDITQKLLLFSQKKKPKSTNLDIQKILNDTIDILRSTTDKKIAIDSETNMSEYFMTGDHSAIQSALMNMGINASHAMPEGGQILFSTQNINLDKVYCDASIFDLEPGEFIEIAISDTGTGIAAENLSKIFDPFFTTKETGQGTGLGLSVTLATIIDHKGAITVESELGKGTIFHIFLPMSEKNAIGMDSDGTILSGAGTILFVDDEEINRITGQEILESLGYTVFLAEDGEEAIEIYKNRKSEIDLVITDMMMPKMNGAEAFDKLREFDPLCKIIIASGYSKEDQLPEFIEPGLSGYIQKPYKISDLSQLVQDLLRT